MKEVVSVSKPVSLYFKISEGIFSFVRQYTVYRMSRKVRGEMACTKGHCSYTVCILDHKTSTVAPIRFSKGNINLALPAFPPSD